MAVICMKILGGGVAIICAGIVSFHIRRKMHKHTQNDVHSERKYLSRQQRKLQNIQDRMFDEYNH